MKFHTVIYILPPILIVALIFLAGCGPTYVPNLPPPPVASAEQQQVILNQIVQEQYPDSVVKPPAILIEFVDYQCPFCQQISSAVREAEAQFGEKLGVITQHFPLDRQCNPYLSRQLHPFACGAALAVECAREQDAFSLYQARIFISKKLDMKSLESHAEELGLDMRAFEQCINDKKGISAVQAHIDRAQRLGIQGTPTFFLNGDRIEVRSPADLSSAIRNAIEKVQSGET